MKYTLTSDQITRLLRWVAYVISFILLVALISWLALPSYIKKTLEEQVQAQTGRKLTVEKVFFNPLLLKVELSDIVLYEEDKQSRAFSADNLVLKISPTSLFYAEPVLREVTLRYPFLKVVRKQRDGKDETNFSDVVKQLATHPNRGKPLQYSISNIQLIGGAIQFDDQLTGKQILIEAINVGVPLVSNFSGAVNTFIEPGISAKVDGSVFDIKARSKPFLDTHETNLELNSSHFDLMHLIGMSPKPLPVKINSAKFSSTLSINFSTQHNVAQIVLSGTANLHDVEVSELVGTSLFKAKSINIHINKANLTTGQIELNLLEINEPEIWARLKQHGVLNWLDLQTDKKNVAATEKVPVIAVANTAKPVFDLTHFQLKNGTVHWSDAANATPAMELCLTKLNIDGQKISTNEKAAPAKIIASVGLDQQPQAHFAGTLDPVHVAVSGEATLSDLSLADYQPYFNRILAANVSGKLSLKTQLSVQKSKLSLNGFSGAIEDLKLREFALANKGKDKRTTSGEILVKKIAIEEMSMNSKLKQAKIEKIILNRVQGEIYRDVDGTVNVSNLFKHASETVEKSAAADGKPGKDKATKSSGWQADINQIVLTNSNFVFGDRSKSPVVNIQADAVEARLEQVSSKFDRPVKMSMSATINDTSKVVNKSVNKSESKFAVNGLIAKKNAQLNVDVQNFSVVVLQPYFTDFLNIKLEKGTVSTTGKLAWNAPSEISYQGSLKSANFSSLNKETSDTLLKWKMLEIGGIDLNLGSRQPKITLGKIDLSNFYARAILSEKGRLNLEDIVVHEHVEAKEQTAVVKSNFITGVATTTVTIPAAATPTSQVNRPVIKIGQINLHNGVINYTDNFIKPHYSMRMTGMDGTIGAIQSALPEPAPINLKGKLDDEAPITISGALNPLFNPILLDVKMTANGIDLPRLTAYSAKYAGYPIQKGKLSFDVEYKVKDNQLTASNSLRIDQLSFGEKVDSPDAIKGPLLFVLSLLTDRNGRITLDVPISGTINDPQFTVGGLIFKVLMNMIGRAITSPFSLLAHTFSGGGSQELSYVEFASGSAALTDAIKIKLDSIAKALEERPNLKLDVIGRADLAADTSGLRERKLTRQIKKYVESQDESASGKPISDANRERALGKIYSDAKFDKPVNKLGFAKWLPAAEMERLILENTEISEDDLLKLANRRDSAVSAYLTETGHVPPDRLFSVAPKINGTDIKDKGTVSRVDFDLKM